VEEIGLEHVGAPRRLALIFDTGEGEFVVDGGASDTAVVWAKTFLTYQIAVR
jgi:hypothetical protein